MLIIDIVGPVFLLIAVGFLSVRFKLFPAAGIAGLVSFVNNFATPCLLFRAMLNVDFRTAFDPGFLMSFYTGAFVAFAIGTATARYGFRRRPGDSVVVGFAAYFTNTVLIGLPIVQRAYGETALPLIYAIVGLHSPLLMSFGTIVMETGPARWRTHRADLAAGDATHRNQPSIDRNCTGVVCKPARCPSARAHRRRDPDDDVGGLAGGIVRHGGALNQYKLRESYGQAVVASILKLVLHPL